ncbi:MAG: 4Fe-4S dicluster domain-containing protein [Chloroflexi bacterium]|nr:4Fe-4S dicluster domain-containing protein [Chloroflexota bacterium]
MVRLGMAIDLNRCIGCHSCYMACKAENFTPPGVFWGRVLEKEIGKYPTVKKMFLPILCNHCEDPACKRVCPTGATSKREDGIVLVDYDKCVGCRACMMACPYDVRFYVKEIRSYFPAGPTPYEAYGYPRFQTNVVQKCTFCSHRVDRGLQPACVETCPTKARYFGDLGDPASEISQLIAQRGGYQLRAELGTNPSVYYLP